MLPINSNLTKRTVHCADALIWLKDSPDFKDCSFVASLPDISEFPSYSLLEWKQWFTETASLILSRCPDEGVSVFYQSDIKVDGVWVDKSFIIQKAAEAIGAELLWHKIICRAPAGTSTFGRPSYSHILCFSKGVRAALDKSTADVLHEMGEKTWQRGMGSEACVMIAKFIQTQTKTTTVVNPFCGEGSMLAAANEFDLNAIGIERSPKRAAKAQKLLLSREGKNWIFKNEE